MTRLSTQESVARPGRGVSLMRLRTKPADEEGRIPIMSRILPSSSAYSHCLLDAGHSLPRHHRPCAGDLDELERRASHDRDGRHEAGHDVEDANATDFDKMAISDNSAAGAIGRLRSCAFGSATNSPSRRCSWRL